MATSELRLSWQETTRLLVEAKALLSAGVAAQHAAHLEDFDEFIDHNELGLAFSYLYSIARESQWDCPPLLDLLKSAATQMRRADEIAIIDERIISLQGCG
jgi:hypothetical protein